MNNLNTITVTSPLLPNLDEFNDMLRDIWDRRWITNMGHYHEQLEKALADYLGVEYISLFTNGTLPLITALQALGITKGEVITTPYSFVATSHAIWWNGLRPVFVDVLPENGNIDPAKIEAAITPDTVAILPVHVYGCPCDVEAIDAIAKKHNLRVIYDAAHAFGVRRSLYSPSPLSPVGKEGCAESSFGDYRMKADVMEYGRLKEHAKCMRKEATPAEDALWQMVRADKMGAKFRRQHAIGTFIADFICLEKMLIVELDGGYHDDPEQQEYDAIRTICLNKMGYRVIRFTNEEVLCDTDNTLLRIQSAMSEPTSPLATGERGLGREAVSVLSYGDISTLSFHATKVFNTIEGGALVCHSAEMKAKIDHLKNFGFEDETTVVAPGINSKMDEIRAAYGLLNLRQVDQAIEARRQVASKYVAALKDVKGINLFPYEIEQVSSFSLAFSFLWNFSYFPILVDEAEYGMSRDALYDKMKAAGVLGRRYFYPLITDFEPYKSYPSTAKENLPVANVIADRVICLPIHHDLSDDDVQRVLDCICQ